MRIIGGQHRSRLLLAPAGQTTRPITDRVKQSLFDILSPRIPGARIYDCFAGTGSMGLECLSRGAAHATFFESDRSALERLRRNIASLSVGSRSTVLPGDLFRHLAAAPKAGLRADLIFLDPPYRFVRELPAELLELGSALQRQHLAAGGLVIFRHDAADDLHLAPLHEVDRRTYGGMTLRFLTHAVSTTSPAPAGGAGTGT